jgi:hypothetical protein
VPDEAAIQKNLDEAVRLDHQSEQPGLSAKTRKARINSALEAKRKAAVALTKNLPPTPTTTNGTTTEGAHYDCAAVATHGADDKHVVVKVDCKGKSTFDKLVFRSNDSRNVVMSVAQSLGTCSPNVAGGGQTCTYGAALQHSGAVTLEFLMAYSGMSVAGHDPADGITKTIPLAGP